MLWLIDTYKIKSSCGFFVLFVFFFFCMTFCRTPILYLFDIFIIVFVFIVCFRRLMIDLMLAMRRRFAVAPLVPATGHSGKLNIWKKDQVKYLIGPFHCLKKKIKEIYRRTVSWDAYVISCPKASLPGPIALTSDSN